MSKLNQALLRTATAAFFLLVSLVVYDASSLSEQRLIGREENQANFYRDSVEKTLTLNEPTESQDVELSGIQQQILLRIYYPDGQKTLTGEIPILWSPPSRSLERPIEYSVYYSSDAGYHWIQIASHIDEPRFLWNSALYAEQGTTYSMKVVAYGAAGGIEVDVTDDAISLDNSAIHDNKADFEYSSIPMPDMQVIHPNGGEILSGEVDVRWTPSSDPLLEPIYYSVFYSANGGYDWTEIALLINKTSLTWDTTLFEEQGTNFLIKVIAYGNSGRIEVAMSNYSFGISNTEVESSDSPLSQILGVFLTFIAIAGIAGVGLGYLLFNPKVKKRTPFNEDIHSENISFLTAIRHKVIIGLDNIRHSILAEAKEIPPFVLQQMSSPAEEKSLSTMADFFPPEIKNDLRSEMKGRTVLALIEIAYQNPTETNPAKLAKSLNIPPSTLSDEIKKLTNLQYLEEYITPQVLRDGRHRNFAITPKGFLFLSILNEALLITINRVKAKIAIEKAYSII
ncbi:MAG: hypothetical protein ACE5OZ_19635 [Candidatus Heimdallarchaeota archaeon]